MALRPEFVAAPPAVPEASGGHRFVVIPAVYLVLRRVVEGRREVLLQFRDGTDYMDRHWACGAAGHIEAGESLWAAACREASEELGIEVRAEDLLALTVMQRRRGDEAIEQRVDFFVVADRWSGEPAIQEPNKASALGWYDLDELPAPVVPHELIVLQGLAVGDLPHVLSLGYDD